MITLKRATIWLALITLIFLVACATDQPTPTPDVQPVAPTLEVAPTEVPAQTTESATPEPTGSYIDELEHNPDPNLIGVVWEWQQRNNADGSMAITVSNPENYAIVFNEDGTFNAILDCNVGNGRYATSGDGGIFMELGPTTLAACPEGSLATEMAMMFGPAQNYRFEDGGNTLVFPWVAGGSGRYLSSRTRRNGD
jgi:heat shock protein HslJ